MKLCPAIKACAIAVLLVIPLARAQQAPSGGSSQPASPQQPAQPVAPEPAGGNSGSGSASQAPPANQAEPDTHALSGGEAFGLGSLYGFRRLFDPSLHFSESGDTGINGGQTQSVTSFGGSLAMREAWTHYRLTVAYRGAKTIYRPASGYNLTYQDLGLSQVIFGGRWTLTLRDDLSYSPEATFGGLGLGGPGFYGSMGYLSNVQPSLSPGQTILTGRARRLYNTALGEIDYAVSRRSTVTFTGSYGLLHFLDPGYIDSRSVNGRFGYDYAIDPRDTISFIYGYNRTSFVSDPGSYDANTVQMAFGRKITGRLAFQISAGPQFLRFQNFGPSNGNKLSWNLSSGLTYGMRLTNYRLSFSHGQTSGSGVFFGAETDRIAVSMTHEFTRFWSGTIDGGYARNSSLTTSTFSAGHFNDWFAGGRIGRQLGRHFTFNVNYMFQKQNTSGVVCQVASCGFTGLRQYFGINIAWHPWAIGR